MVETTSEANGYPRNLRDVIVGFENFAQAEEFAKEIGGELIMLHRRDGQQLWSRRDAWISGPIDPRDYLDDEVYIYEHMSEDEWMDECRYLLENVESIGQLKNLVKAMEEIWDEIDTAGEDEIVVTRHFQHVATLSKELMEFSWDSHNYVIGVMEV